MELERKLNSQGSLLQSKLSGEDTYKIENRKLKDQLKQYREDLREAQDKISYYQKYDHIIKKYEDLKILTDEESSKLFNLKQNKASLEFKLSETVLEHKNNIEKRELKTFEIRKIEKRIFEFQQL